MIIEYENGIMIVTHETGVVDGYDVLYLQGLKTAQLEKLACCQVNIDCLDEYITNAEATVEPPEPIV